VPKTCSICGQKLDPNPLSGPAHARKHKNQFRDLTGRFPDDYEEVREFFEEEIAALEDFE
jgi:hypothetical protein